MSIPVTINLPDDVYHRAERFAVLSNQDLSSVLTDTIVHSLPSISSALDRMPSIGSLTDPEIIALTQLEMESSEDTRLSELLDKQQAGTLVENDSIELDGLMQIYREGLLRKATALAEAVKRGLTILRTDL
jgi:predicted transcriptional regulator